MGHKKRQDKQKQSSSKGPVGLRVDISAPSENESAYSNSLGQKIITSDGVPMGSSQVTRQESGVLIGEEIKALGLIREETADWNACLKSTCYDLRLGPQVFICGEGSKSITTLSDGQIWVVIKPFQSILFSTMETVCLPDGIVGRFDLKIGLGLDGLIMQVGPQIHPGYEGPLFGLILNTTGSNRSIMRGASFAAVEFSRTTIQLGESLQPEKISSLEQFIDHQHLSLERLGERSAIARIYDELEQCRTTHQFRLSEAAVSTGRLQVLWAKKAVRWTFVAILVAVIIGISTIGVTLVQGRSQPAEKGHLDQDDIKTQQVQSKPTTETPAKLSTETAGAMKNGQ